MRQWQAGSVGALLAMALSACASTAPVLPPGPLDVHIDVAKRGWHTDLCIAPTDLSGRVATLASEFPGAEVLCFGFGERHYMMDGDHSTAEMLSSLAPSEAVVLVTPLQVPPAQAFGPEEGAEVVPLRISDAGARSLSGFIWGSLQTGTNDAPEQLRRGINPGSMFFAASSSYNAFATCNTWSASGLRAAGLPVTDAVIFADDIMSQVRKVAAAQAGIP